MKDSGKAYVLLAELAENERVLKELFDKRILLKQKFNRIEPDEFDWYALGFLMHNIYGAIESYFLRVAKFFENDIDKSQWHKSLLERMKLDIETVRPRVISPEVYKLLDELRGFRHVFRYVYQFELDIERLQMLDKKIDVLERIIRTDLEKLEDFIKDLTKKAEETV
ncbi:MAG: antitoxin [bacterium]|nr:antitoxin [bacterium]